MKLRSKKLYTSRGVSLVEAVIYFALFAVLSLVVVQTMIVLVQSFGRLAVERHVLYGGTAAMERVIYEVRNAVAIDEDSSIFATSSGSLVYTISDPENPGETLERSIVVSGDTLVLSEEGLAVGDITTGSVEVTNFYIDDASSAIGEAVRVSLGISRTAGTATVQKNFYTTIVVRALTN